MEWVWNRRRGGVRRALNCALAAWVMSCTGTVFAETDTTVEPDFVQPPIEARATPEDTYKVNAFSAIHVEETSGRPFVERIVVTWKPRMGIYRQPLSYSTFYRALGRTDLADAFEARFARGRALYWTGVVTSVVGLGVAIIGFSKGKATVGFIGAGGYLLGLPMRIIGDRWQQPEVSEADARTMIEGYNKLLQQRIEHDDSARPSPPTRAAHLRDVRLIPVLTLFDDDRREALALEGRF